MTDDYHPTCHRCGQPVPFVFRQKSKLRTCEACQQKRRAEYAAARPQRHAALKADADRLCKRCNAPVGKDSIHTICWECRQILIAKQREAAEQRGPLKVPTPTVAPPGSSRKVEVLAQRVASRCELWSDDDCDRWDAV